MYRRGHLLADSIRLRHIFTQSSITQGQAVPQVRMAMSFRSGGTCNGSASSRPQRPFRLQATFRSSCNADSGIPLTLGDMECALNAFHKESICSLVPSSPRWKCALSLDRDFNQVNADYRHGGGVKNVGEKWEENKSIKIP